MGKSGKEHRAKFNDRNSKRDRKIGQRYEQPQVQPKKKAA